MAHPPKSPGTAHDDDRAGGVVGEMPERGPGPGAQHQQVGTDGGLERPSADPETYVTLAATVAVAAFRVGDHARARAACLDFAARRRSVESPVLHAGGWTSSILDIHDDVSDPARALGPELDLPVQPRPGPWPSGHAEPISVPRTPASRRGGAEWERGSTDPGMILPVPHAAGQDR